jgi:hypothetical protein
VGGGRFGQEVMVGAEDPLRLLVAGAVEQFG